MNRLWIFAALSAVVLSGCSAAQPTWETVDDSIALDAGSYLDDAYIMEFDVPMQAQRNTGGSRTVWADENGDYEIVCETVLSSDVNAVIERVSGFSPDKLQIVQTTRYSMPEYQFAWYASGEEGGRLCRADVLTDGTYCYTLCVSCAEDVAAEYDSTVQAVFATLRLQENEGF